ncbi:flotillin family protein [Verrucomicrobiales bacterium]|nr:flotillin family protein [Verrucomicrobiales bacterium]
MQETGPFGLILIISLVVITLGAVIFFFSRYQKCPSDRILVIYGKTARGRSSICLHGGAAFIWPVIQAFEYMDLTPIAIDCPLQGALDKEGNRVNTPSTFTVGISTDPGVMANAAERLLGQPLSSIEALASQIIFSQMRLAIGELDTEALNSDRDLLIGKVAQYVDGALAKFGLKLINVNIKDITDESGYLTALGEWASAGKPEITENVSIPIEPEQKNISSSLTPCEQWHVEGSELQFLDWKDEPIERASVELKVLYGSKFTGTTNNEGVVKLG